MNEDQPNKPAPEGVENIETLKAERDKAKNDYLYLMADFDNYRKNAIKERSELLKYGGERLVRELLNVLDNFDRALETPLTAETIPTFREGISMIASELSSLLSKNGVEEIPAEGLPFDPSKHEALSSEPSDQFTQGIVTRVFKKAYRLHDKVIRPAQVVVSSGSLRKENSEG